MPDSDSRSQESRGGPSIIWAPSLGKEEDSLRALYDLSRSNEYDPQETHVLRALLGKLFSARELLCIYELIKRNEAGAKYFQDSTGSAS